MIVILEYIGDLEIEQGVVFQDPKMQLMSIDYDLVTNGFRLVVDFWELKYRHAIVYESLNADPSALSAAGVLDFVANHPLLSQFGPIPENNPE